MICATEILRTKIKASFLIVANLLLNYFDLAGASTPEVIKMLLTITKPEHIMYVSDFLYQLDRMLIKNLSKLKEYLKSDKALAPYAEKILRGNADKLFNKNR